jgi:hypothetical protein
MPYEKITFQEAEKNIGKRFLKLPFQNKEVVI